MSLFAVRRGAFLRYSLGVALAVLVFFSVLTVVLDGTQYVSRDGPWAQSHLARPLPLRVFQASGHWQHDPNATDTDTHTAPQPVTFVKFVAASLRVEEHTSEEAPECSKAEAADGCLVWASRDVFVTGNASSKEKKPRKAGASGLSGSVHSAFRSEVKPGMTAPLSALTLRLREGTVLGRDSLSFSLLSQWNRTDTATMDAGMSRWVSFGGRTRRLKDSLQDIFPEESGKYDDDVRTRDTSKQRDDKTKESGFLPAKHYFKSQLSSPDAVKLFANLYLRAEEQREKDRNSSSSSEKAPLLSDNLTFAKLLSADCFWIAQVVYNDFDNPTGVTNATAWSTCGDRIAWTVSTAAFEASEAVANLVAFLAIFVVALPMLAGTVHQIRWMRNSRTRMLRVNPYQLIMTALMISLTTARLTVSNDSGTSSMAVLLTRSRAVFLLFSIAMVNEVVLFQIFFWVDSEFTRYFSAQDNSRRAASHRTLLFFVVICFLPALVLSLVDLHNPWVVGLLALTFWAPQVVHCFTMDGWTGLTAPFIVTNLLLVCAPLLTPLLTPAPWTLPRSHAIAIAVALGVLFLEGGVLLAVRLNSGKNLLPRWLARWRHTYTTTAEAERAALQESPLCPICRNPLAEGWDEHDELWRTPCRHLFHKSCLERWMQERTECPLCRKLLPEP